MVALGAVPRTLPVPGLAEHAVGFKDLADAIALRTTSCESSRSPTRSSIRGAARTSAFVFVGAGYAGVEALAELSDLVDDVLASTRASAARGSAGCSSTRLQDPPRDPAGSGLRGARAHPARLRAPRRHDTRVLATAGRPLERRAHPDAHARLDRRRAGNPTLGQLGLPLDDRGRVGVDALLRVEGHDRLWSLGDCAAVPNHETPGVVDPPTCQHALRQARAWRRTSPATSTVRVPDARPGGDARPLQGDRGRLGIRIRGFPGWFVTRTYHLYQLPLVTRKLRVVADWTTSLFFRRDVVELSGLGHPHRLE